MDVASERSNIPPGYVELAANADFVQGRGYKKRKGYTNLLSSVSSPWDGLAYRQGIEFTAVEGGSSEIILYGTDDSADGRIGKTSAGDVLDILTGISATDRLSLFQFSNLLFGYNGNTPFIYDGAATRQVGITAPATAPTLNTTNDISPTEGLTVDGSYIYAYTYRNSQTLAESSPSPLSDIIDLQPVNPNNEIVIDLAAGDSATADEIVIYRTTAGGSVLFEEDTVGIASTSFTSNTPDDALSTRQLEFDNSRITDFTSAPEFPTVARNRVFVKTGPNEGRFSKIGQSGPMPESFEAKAFFSTESEFGFSDDLIGFAEIKDVPIVLKKRSIGRLEEVGLQNLTSAVDNVAYIYKEISNNTGAISHWAGDEVFDEYVFLSKDNVYATNGISVRPVADRLQTLIRNLGFTDLQRSKISAINNRSQQKILFQVFSNRSQPEPDLVLVGDYQLYPEFRWAVYTKGEDEDTHPGIKAGCFFEVEESLDGAREIYFGNALGNGKLYQMELNDSDDGDGIAFEIVDRPRDMGQPLNKKLYKDLDFWAQGANNNYQLEVCAIYNLTKVQEFCQNFTLPADGNSWGDPVPANNAEDVLLWDIGVWGSASNDINLTYTAHRKARYQQLVFKQFDADAPVTLMNWGTSAAIDRAFRAGDAE
jgi:hypothetical protein